MTINNTMIDASDVSELVALLQKLDKNIENKSTVKIQINDCISVDIYRKHANCIEVSTSETSTTGLLFEGFCDSCGILCDSWNFNHNWLCDDCDKPDTTAEDEYNRVVREGLK